MVIIHFTVHSSSAEPPLLQPRSRPTRVRTTHLSSIPSCKHQGLSLSPDPFRHLLFVSYTYLLCPQSQGTGVSHSHFYYHHPDLFSVSCSGQRVPNCRWTVRSELGPHDPSEPPTSSLRPLTLTRQVTSPGVLPRHTWSRTGTRTNRDLHNSPLHTPDIVGGL